MDEAKVGSVIVTSAEQDAKEPLMHVGFITKTDLVRVRMHGGFLLRSG